jgi:hypothetical protein
MSDSPNDLSPDQSARITAYVDIEAPPPNSEPVALVLYGTNQLDAPVRIAADRYHQGAAPLIIATGGVNRHTGIVEGRELARQLAEAGVPESAVRVEDQSRDTWQNIELSMPHLREALALGLPLVAVSKWYHLRAVYCPRTQLPEAAPLYAISWEPVYAGMLVTRDSWPSSPDGRRRVVRESREVPRRIAGGSYLPAEKKDGAWWLCLLVRVPTRRPRQSLTDGGAFLRGTRVLTGRSARRTCAACRNRHNDRTFPSGHCWSRGPCPSRCSGGTGRTGKATH